MRRKKVSTVLLLREIFVCSGNISLVLESTLSGFFWRLKVLVFLDNVKNIAPYGETLFPGQKVVVLAVGEMLY